MYGSKMAGKTEIIDKVEARGARKIMQLYVKHKRDHKTKSEVYAKKKNQFSYIVSNFLKSFWEESTGIWSILCIVAKYYVIQIQHYIVRAYLVWERRRMGNRWLRMVIIYSNSQ